MMRGLILLIWLVSLAVNAPGHLSYDSIVQLTEGRTGVFAGFHPPLMSALLGFFDHVLPGTALYLVGVSALFYLPLIALAGGDAGRRPLNWLASAALVLLIATPFLLIYQGIVWKDVLFANLSLSTFACLVQADREARRPARLFCFAAAAVLAALAMATRQNGLLVPVFAAAALAWPMTNFAGLRRRILASSAWLLLVGVAFLATQAAIARVATQPVGSGFAKGLIVLQRYDIVGMIAHGAPPFDGAAADTDDAARVTAAFRRDYEASRLDRVMKTPEVIAYFTRTGLDGGQWWRMVRQNPGAWLAHRAAVFRWMVFPSDVRECLPVWVGVDGPAEQISALGLSRGARPQDSALYAYATRWFGTPLFVNGAWALLAVALGAVLLRRRRSGDVTMVLLLGTALAFCASFALIGIACDVRYLFLLPVACCGALAQLAAAAKDRAGSFSGSGRSASGRPRSPPAPPPPAHPF